MNKKELESTLCDLLGIDKVTLLIKQQITKFVTKHGYSYKDIARAIYYFVEVKKQEPDLSRGIGIVPYMHEDSKKFFERLKQDQLRQEREAEKMKKSKEKPIFYVKPKKRKKPNKSLNMEDI